MKFNYENLRDEEDDALDKPPFLEFGNHKIFEPLPEEVEEEYLSRVMNGVVDIYTGHKNNYNNPLVSFKKMYSGRHADSSISEFFSYSINSFKLKKMLFSLESSSNNKFSEIKNKKVFNQILLSIRGSNREILNSHDNYQNMDFYCNTNQKRDFFAPNRGKDAHAYASMIFALPEAFIEKKSGEEYLHKKIDDKTIFLFGGGDSIRDLLKSEKFKPKKVINFDPFIKEESIDKNSNSIYESQMISATDNKIREMIDKDEIPKADEVWATYSVPFYLNKSSEIKELFKNLKYVIRENGNARISPIVVQSVKRDGETFENRKEALLLSIKEIQDDPDYNLSIYNDTINIHKIKHGDPKI